MRLASSTAVSDGEQAAKNFSAAEFPIVMQSANFIGALRFWRTLERLAAPESRTRLHAMGVLAELAQSWQSTTPEMRRERTA